MEWAEVIIVIVLRFLLQEFHFPSLFLSHCLGRLFCDSWYLTSHLVILCHNQEVTFHSLTILSSWSVCSTDNNRTKIHACNIFSRIEVASAKLETLMRWYLCDQSVETHFKEPRALLLACSRIMVWAWRQYTAFWFSSFRGSLLEQQSSLYTSWRGERQMMSYKEMFYFSWTTRQ